MGVLMNVTITAYLHQKLTEIGTAGFVQLSVDTGVKVSFIRKFFYGGRKDPRVSTIQPLLDFFQSRDSELAVQSHESSVCAGAAPLNTEISAVQGEGQ